MYTVEARFAPYHGFVASTARPEMDDESNSDTSTSENNDDEEPVDVPNDEQRTSATPKHTTDIPVAKDEESDMEVIDNASGTHVWMYVLYFLIAAILIGCARVLYLRLWPKSFYKLEEDVDAEDVPKKSHPSDASESESDASEKRDDVQLMNMSNEDEQNHI